MSNRTWLEELQYVLKVKFYQWLSRKLPHDLIYFAVVWAWAKVTTTGEWSKSPSTGITVEEVLSRFHSLKWEK